MVMNDTHNMNLMANLIVEFHKGQIFALGSVDYVKEKLEVGYRLFITPK